MLGREPLGACRQLLGACRQQLGACRQLLGAWRQLRGLYCPSLVLRSSKLLLKVRLVRLLGLGMVLQCCFCGTTRQQCVWPWHVQPHLIAGDWLGRSTEDCSVILVQHFQDQGRLHSGCFATLSRHVRQLLLHLWCLMLQPHVRFKSTLSFYWFCIIGPVLADRTVQPIFLLGKLHMA